MKSILIVLGLMFVFAITPRASSAQLLLQKLINKQHTSISRKGLIVASAAKVSASPHEDANTGASQSANAGATFTVPNLGDGFYVIPTPTFNYTNIANAGNWGFTALVWGNSLGVDSNKLKAASNLLVPDISLVGLKLQGAYAFTSSATRDFKFGADIDLNLLVKKVSYFDLSSKLSTNFNPFVFHPRIGITGALEDIIFVSVYGNVLSVLNHNDEFSIFFNTNNKSTFFYPEIDVAAIVNLDNTGKQQIKFEFDMLINNGDLQTIYTSSNKVIPYIKVGLVTAL